MTGGFGQMVPVQQLMRLHLPQVSCWKLITVVALAHRVGLLQFLMQSAFAFLHWKRQFLRTEDSRLGSGLHLHNPSLIDLRATTHLHFELQALKCFLHSFLQTGLLGRASISDIHMPWTEYFALQAPQQTGPGQPAITVVLTLHMADSCRASVPVTTRSRTRV